MATTTIEPSPLHPDEELLELHLDGATRPTEGKKRIFIIAPGHHSSHSKLWRTQVKTIMETAIPGFEFVKATISGGGVAKARNIMVANAYYMQVDAILCWDTDVALPGDGPDQWIAALMRLLSWPKELGNVSGLYAAKSAQSRWIMTAMPGERRQPNGLLRVIEAGTGLKLVWMWQVIAMINRYEATTYTPDDSTVRQTMWDLFSMGVVNGRYLSEDYYFDHRLREMGFSIWVDTGIRTKHRGETPDGRVVDYPTVPLALPGLPAVDPPASEVLPHYLLTDPFANASGTPDLQGWSGTWAPVFADLIGKINPTVIVEVGSWKGASALHIASLCDATIYCCDTWLGGIDHALSDGEIDQLPRISPGALFHQFCVNVHESGQDKRIIPVPQTSINAARWLKAKGVRAPIVYVDASHEYADVAADLVGFWPIVLPGGCLLGDDFGDEKNPGVERAVRWFAGREKLRVNVTDTHHWYIVKPEAPK